MQIELNFEPLALEPGDRVRIRKPDSEYTGCRGTIAPAPGTRMPSQAGQATLPLGYFVAIDGENGVARPFLSAELEPVRVASVRPLEAVDTRARGGSDRSA
jgi:hypothetical protein